MKETVATIPLMDAFQAEDECPFCFLEREAEQHAISFILGSAYMEDDIRMNTDESGFCRHHYKMMYDYGNRLGSALILSTHMKKLNQEMTRQMKEYKSGKSSFVSRMRKTDANQEAPETSLGAWLDEKEKSCYVCDHFKSNYQRYLDTFFDMYKKNPEFKQLFENSKGFCLPHFRDLVEVGEKKLNDKQKAEFFPKLFELMQSNLKRLEEEVTWFVEKNDYRNKDADWGSSRDSIQRAMQKASSGYPADPVFKMNP